MKELTTATAAMPGANGHKRKFRAASCVTSSMASMTSSMDLSSTSSVASVASSVDENEAETVVVAEHVLKNQPYDAHVSALKKEADHEPYFGFEFG